VAKSQLKFALAPGAAQQNATVVIKVGFPVKALLCYQILFCGT